MKELLRDIKEIIIEWALPISLGINVILSLALFFAIASLLVVNAQKKQYENTFAAKMAFNKNECKKLNPCKPCEKFLTKEELKQEVLKEITKGDILKVILPQEQYKELLPYLDSNTSRE
ncbi:MAG: hypothetical protein PHG82_03365 [Candidatus Gracilibacteria bacterium]|nr:hypothetical protein [Candidatus Gracilibacteria bacterium]